MVSCLTLTSLSAIPELYERGLGFELVGWLAYRHRRLTEVLEHYSQPVDTIASESPAADLDLCGINHYFQRCCW